VYWNPFKKTYKSENTLNVEEKGYTHEYIRKSPLHTSLQDFTVCFIDRMSIFIVLSKSLIDLIRCIQERYADRLHQSHQLRGLSEAFVNFDHSKIGTVSSDPMRGMNTCLLLRDLFGKADVCTCGP
jgi:hypothetical protein